MRFRRSSPTTPVAVLVALCVVLAGCGSQLTPEEVRRANGIAGDGSGVGAGDGAGTGTDGGPGAGATAG
ncbi:MAG: hypothetical protein ACRDT4_24075, partial [Micromonosporaceae bacterium]